MQKASASQKTTKRDKKSRPARRMYREFNFRNAKPLRPSIELERVRTSVRNDFYGENQPSTAIKVAEAEKKVPRAAVRYLNDETGARVVTIDNPADRTIDIVNPKSWLSKFGLPPEIENLLELALSEVGDCSTVDPAKRDSINKQIANAKLFATGIDLSNGTNYSSKIDEIVKEISCLNQVQEQKDDKNNGGEVFDADTVETKPASSNKLVYAGLGGAAVGTATFLVTKKPVVSIAAGGVSCGIIYYLQKKQEEKAALIAGGTDGKA